MIRTEYLIIKNQICRNYQNMTSEVGVENSMEFNETVKSVLDNLHQLNETKLSTKTLKAKLLATPLGSMFAISNETHLLFLSFTDSKNFPKDIKHLIKLTSRTIIEGETKPLKQLTEELEMYFNGKLREFHTPISIDETETEYQRQIWEEMAKIPYAEVSSYSKLAEAIGKPKSYRAAANACGRNPLTIVIPCHRVLKSDGSLGGFGCGTERKIWLLDHEKKFK